MGVERLTCMASITSDQSKRNRYQEEYLDHLALLDSGHDIDMLAQAFANLKNLETVEIRDFRSTSRYRDAPNLTWKSYGVATYEAETGVSLEFLPIYGAGHRNEEPADYASRLFQNMLRALGRTTVRPRRFEVNLTGSGINEKAFKIQKYDETSILPVLAGLKDLYLDLSTGFQQTYFVQVQGNPVAPCWSYHIREFFSLIPNIEHLRLNFQHFRDSEARDFISWLSKPSTGTVLSAAPPSPNSLPQSPPPVLLKHLRQLELGKAVLEPKALLTLLQKHRATLRGIEFYRVGLLDSSQSQGRHNQWAKLFGNMAKLGLRLNRIVANLLKQEKSGRRQTRRVNFKDSPGVRRVWEGQDLDGALKDLVNNVVVDWPEEDTGSSQSDSDEDSEDGELFSLRNIHNISSPISHP
jgi:hypothetical protein